MRKLWVLLLSIMLFASFGCATTWQNKATVTYTSGAIGVSSVHGGFKPQCDSATLPADRCDQLKKIYNDTRDGYVAAGNILILALTTEDAVQKDQLMAQWDILWENFTRLTKEMIELIQRLTADATGTALPAQSKITITPDMIGWIVAALSAVINAIPAIYAAIMAGHVDPGTIEAYVDMIVKAQNSIPVWN